VTVSSPKAPKELSFKLFSFHPHPNKSGGHVKHFEGEGLQGNHKTEVNTQDVKQILRQ
jgi:hypothetical protein